MKTIKQKSGKIERVKDSEAILRVKSGNWEYCPKSEWKQLNVTETSEEKNDRKTKKKSSSKA